MSSSVAIIDPVGSKAGIDQYDLLLLRGMKVAGFDCTLYSNFEYSDNDIRYHRQFFNTGVAKWKSILSLFTGFFKSLIHARKQKTDWLILHVFRAGLFDLFSFALARLMGFKILAIVHDIESLDTFTLPIIRRTVIGTLPQLRVVHNQFCKDELAKSIGSHALKNTGIVPHVNFTYLFHEFHIGNTKSTELLNDANLVSGIDPKFSEILKSKIPLLLFFGQIKKAKGLDILLDAIPLCKSEFKLIIAGKLRNENWQKYESMIVKNKIEDKVLPLIRHISDKERDLLFLVSSAIVLPYRWIYQSGVLLMTMSFPMAVIASDLPPNKDLIQDGSNGLLFRSEDANELATKIDDLISGKTDAVRLKQQALKDVTEFYSPEKIGAAFAKLISGY